MRVRGAGRVLVLSSVVAFSGACQRDGGEGAAVSPAAALRSAAEQIARGAALVRKKCARCHPERPAAGAEGLPFADHLGALREELAAYDAKVRRLKILHPAHYRANARSIEAILAERDPARRLELWLGSYLARVTFDDPKNRMTQPSLGRGEIEVLVRYLLSVRPSD